MGNKLLKNLLKRPEPASAIRGTSIVLLVGLIGFAIPQTRVLFKALTPLIILVGVITALRYHEGDRSTAFILVSVIIALAGFFIEAIGVNTGVIFGTYTYGDVLGPKVLHTPLIIGLNWWLLVYTARAIVEYWDTTEWIKVPTTAILVTVFDIVLEPVAIQLGFWSWEGLEVPMQNYIAWFIIALVFATLFAVSRIKLMNEMGGPVFFTLFLFFVLLNGVFLFL